MNPSLEWRKMKGRPCLLLKFNGLFSADDAQLAISRISSMIGEVEENFSMIWECTGMEDYEWSARDEWKDFIGSIKPRIDRIHLVSNRLIIRTGAMFIGVFTGLRIATHDTIDGLLD